MIFVYIFALTVLSGYVHGGHITVSNTPDSIKFAAKPQHQLKTSELSDVIAAAMGYTTKKSMWDGLTVVDPFNAPSQAVVLALKSHNSEIHLNGTTYPVTEDVTIHEIYSDLKEKVTANSQRLVYFNMSEVADLAAPTIPPSSPASLKEENSVDRDFLFEVTALPSVAAKKRSDGQQFLFLQMRSFGVLVNTYGDASPQVGEAKALIGQALSLLSVAAPDSLVLSLVTDSVETSHQQRNILQADAKPEPDASNLNLALAYSGEYAAIFTMILFLAIALALIVAAVSVAIATMDPGRDSIIYRMTNPRIKKDN